jgi:hypothetical protein
MILTTSRPPDLEKLVAPRSSTRLDDIFRSEERLAEVRRSLLQLVDRLDRRVLQGWNVLMANMVVTVVTTMLAEPSPFR